MKIILKDRMKDIVKASTMHEKSVWTTSQSCGKCKFPHHTFFWFCWIKIQTQNMGLLNQNSLFDLIRWFFTATSGTKPIIVSAGHVYILLHQKEKRGSTIQYDYRKRRTHAWVFSQTLTHGNSMNEIRQRNRGRRHEERREYGSK